MCLVVATMVTVTAGPAGAATDVFSTTLTGAAEVPPVATAATGTGTVYLNAAETQIRVDLSFTGLSAPATAAHIHGPAPVGVATGIVFGLPVPAATSGAITTQTFAVTPAQVTELRGGLWYFNVHTAPNPGGEIRGQIGLAPSSRLFIGTMRGIQEVPSVATAARGKGTVWLNAAETEINVELSFTGLSGPASAAHIHGPAAIGVEAGVLFGLTVPAETSGVITTQTFAVTPAQVTELRSGLWYFNVHTGANPGGEIRGQIFPAQALPLVVRTSTNWLLRNSQSTGDNTLASFAFGVRPLVPVTGDWDGNGSKTPGIYKSGQFTLSNAYAASPSTNISYGTDPRGFPVSGDFDGNGIDDVAVYRNGLWQIRLSTGATGSFTFGAGAWPSTVPVVGDWDGDGIDGIGTYDFATATWSLRQSASAGLADAGSFQFGTNNGTYPVVGDWNGDGVDTVGTKLIGSTTWELRNSNSAGAANVTFSYGLDTDLPLTWR